MPRGNSRASYVDVTLHQAARREALSRLPDPDEPMTVKAFVWTMLTILCAIVAVLWFIHP